MIDLQDVIGTREAANLIGATREHVAHLIRSGLLPGKKVGREWITLRSAALDYRRSERKPGPKPEQRC